MRCVCGPATQTTSAHNAGHDLLKRDGTKKKDAIAVPNVVVCRCGAVVTKVEFITSNRERNAMPGHIIIGGMLIKLV